MFQVTGNTLIFLLQIIVNTTKIEVPYYRTLIIVLSLYTTSQYKEPSFFDGLWFGVVGTYVLSFLWTIVLRFWHEVVFIKVPDVYDDYLD